MLWPLCCMLWPLYPIFYIDGKRIEDQDVPIFYSQSVETPRRTHILKQLMPPCKLVMAPLVSGTFGAFFGVPILLALA